MLSAMGKTKKIYECVDLEKLMCESGLDYFHPVEVSCYLLCLLACALECICCGRPGPS